VGLRWSGCVRWGQVGLLSVPQAFVIASLVLVALAFGARRF
jgi:hypothetical protein